MVIDPKDVIPFLIWLPGAALSWLVVVACVVAGVTAIGWLVAAMRHGPWVATRTTVAVLRATVLDLVHLSPRRVCALARLAVKESIRRRVVVVFAVFILILLFAGWFRSRQHRSRPPLPRLGAHHHQLSGAAAGFAVEFAQSADRHQNRTCTVVTKPVRASEVVLGHRGLRRRRDLVASSHGRVSYVRRARTRPHPPVTAEDLQPVEGEPAAPAAAQAAFISTATRQPSIGGPGPRRDGAAALALLDRAKAATGGRAGGRRQDHLRLGHGRHVVGPHARVRKTLLQDRGGKPAEKASAWATNGLPQLYRRRS